jgi:hypothetical protein
MGPKVDKPNSSKKAVRAKKEQKIDDLTFGIKNKNKSSKVKLFIDRAEKCVKHSFGDLDAVSYCSAHEDSVSVFQWINQDLMWRAGENLNRHLNLLIL